MMINMAPSVIIRPASGTRIMSRKVNRKRTNREPRSGSTGCSWNRTAGSGSVTSCLIGWPGLPAAGLRFLVNVVQDALGRIVGCFSGHPVAAFEEGCRTSLEIFAAPVKQPADIVIAGSYPADVDLWQASKGIYAADLALNPGGTLILVTPCPEGVSTEHTDLASIVAMSHGGELMPLLR